ncbi:hypothetical protein Q669_31540 [Labrenzia sp. C1B10]|nr:hypothetical protein Q669_31540 [Labrenzia sp. C1B10]ERS09570.1 hypothetical protein Q675_00130 [Labrenzia sp. C1B70]
MALLAMTALNVAGLRGADAQEISLITGGKFARIEGSIQLDGDERFLEFLKQNPGIIGLQLDSPGGVVVSAIEMADEISKRKLSTYIADGDTCAAACSLIFFAGHDRLVKGRLGVHQMDDGGRGTASALQFVLAKQLDAFQRFGIPWAITQRMLTTLPSDMYWIPDYEIAELGINRDLPGDATDVAVAQSAPTYAPGDMTSKFKFADYLPDGYLTGSAQSPDFNGRDKDYRTFRTRIRNGVAEGLNFAGHHAFIEIGCGTSCRIGFVVDLQTGQVFDFPYGGEEYYQLKLLYSPDSRLLKVRWKGDWELKECTEQDLLLEGYEWRVLEERTVFTVDGYCN